MHSLPFLDGIMPIQPFLELAALFGLFTLGAYWLERQGHPLNKLFQATASFAIAYWYLKYRLYPPLPFNMLITCLAVAGLAVCGWVSSNETYWQDCRRPLLAVLDGETTRTRAIRLCVLVALPLGIGLWSYATLLPLDPSANGPIDLRTYHPAPPSEITIYSPEDFRH